MDSELIGLLGLVAILLGGGYIFLSKKNKKIDAQKAEISYPLRLQAYERMILFLERIKPQNLLTRINAEGLSTLELQSLLLRQIKSELDHNIAQQLYLKKNTWEAVVLAANTMSASLVHGINSLSDTVDAKNAILHLLKNEDMSSTELVDKAIEAIKDEAQENF